MKLLLGKDFPASPPKGYFLTKIFHPNVGANGEICVNVLKRDWTAELGIRHVLLVSSWRGLPPPGHPSGAWAVVHSFFFKINSEVVGDFCVKVQVSSWKILEGLAVLDPLSVVVQVVPCLVYLCCVWNAQGVCVMGHFPDGASQASGEGGVGFKL